jgi:hypothetical protein
MIKTPGRKEPHPEPYLVKMHVPHVDESEKAKSHPQPPSKPKEEMDDPQKRIGQLREEKLMSKLLHRPQELSTPQR